MMSVYRDEQITSSQRIFAYPTSKMRYPRLWLARVRFETANSIPRNTRNIRGKMRPEEFGMIDPLEAPMPFERVELIPS